MKLNRKKRERFTRTSKPQRFRTARRRRSPIKIWEFENYVKERLKAAGIIQ